MRISTQFHSVLPCQPSPNHKLFHSQHGAAGSLLLLLVGVLSMGTMAYGQANVHGQWKTLSTQMPINPVHAALMHTGKVLIVSGSGNVSGNTNLEAAVWDPATDTVTTQHVAWDMFCNGMVVLPDGRPFIFGGTLQYDPFHGQLMSATFDPSTSTFTNQASMHHGRWYPTGTTLGDGSVMVFSGLLETGGTNKAVEIFKAASGWSSEFTAPFTPPLYPRMHLLPDGTVFNSGSSIHSNIFNPSSHTWSQNVATTNFSGTRTYGTSVLLPLSHTNGYKAKVMILGGGTTGSTGTTTATTEIIDLSVSPLKWVNGPSMSQARIEMNATILPSGKVLATGGSSIDEDGTTASLNADLFDPASDTFSSAGANAFPRLYHSNALLLPDATVLVFGGNPARGTFEPHLEIYSPAYLFNSSGGLATRPTISTVPAGAIAYNSSFQVSTPNAASISSVVILRATAVTHAFNMEQRMVDLPFTKGSGVLTVTAPPNGNIAPPGYYLLFVIENGVPSVAKFIHF